MTPVEVSQRPVPDVERVVFGAGQPQYLPLPALRSREGVVWTEWELSPDERATVAAGGRIRLRMHTFNEALQPVRIEIVPAPRQENRDAAASSVSAT